MTESSGTDAAAPAAAAAAPAADAPAAPPAPTAEAGSGSSAGESAGVGTAKDAAPAGTPSETGAAPAATAASASTSTSTSTSTWARLGSSSTLLYRTDSLGLNVDTSSAATLDLMFGSLPSLRSPSLVNDAAPSYFAIPAASGPGPGAGAVSSYVVSGGSADLVAAAATVSALGSEAAGAGSAAAPGAGSGGGGSGGGGSGSSGSGGGSGAATEGWRRRTPSAITLPPLPGLRANGASNVALLPSPSLVTPDGFAGTSTRRRASRSRTASADMASLADLTEKDSDAASILQAISSPPVLTTEENIFEKTLALPTAAAAAATAAPALAPAPAPASMAPTRAATMSAMAAANAAAAVAAATLAKGRSTAGKAAGQPPAAAAHATYMPLANQVLLMQANVALGGMPGVIPVPVPTSMWPSDVIAARAAMASMAVASAAAAAGPAGGAASAAAVAASSVASAPVPRKRKGEPEDQEMLERKRLRRRERCRQAATKFRVKKRQEMQGLEQQAAGAQILHAQLAQEVKNLQQRVLDLKAFLLLHRDCPGLANATLPSGAAASGPAPVLAAAPAAPRAAGKRDAVQA